MTTLRWKVVHTGEGRESDKLVIFNHALPMCRAGFPAHLGEPWSNFDAVQIDFMMQMKHLTDAGYNVLAYWLIRWHEARTTVPRRAHHALALIQRLEF